MNDWQKVGERPLERGDCLNRESGAKVHSFTQHLVQQANHIWEWKDLGPLRVSSVLFTGNVENHLKGPLTGLNWLCALGQVSFPLWPSLIVPALNFPDYSVLQPRKLHGIGGPGARPWRKELDLEKGARCQWWVIRPWGGLECSGWDKIGQGGWGLLRENFKSQAGWLLNLTR